MNTIKETFAKIDELRAAFFKYGAHSIVCGIHDRKTNKCSCGLAELREKYKDKPEVKEDRLPFGMVVPGKNVELK